MRHVIFNFYSYLFSPNEQRGAGGGGGGGILPEFLSFVLFSFTTVQQTTSRIGHREKYK